MAKYTKRPLLFHTLASISSQFKKNKILEFMKNSPTCQYYFTITPTIMPLNFFLKIMYRYACYKLKYIWGFKDFDHFGIHMSGWAFNHISNYRYGTCILTFAKHKDNQKIFYIGHNKWLLESMHIFLIAFSCTHSTCFGLL